MWEKLIRYIRSSAWSQVSLSDLSSEKSKDILKGNYNMTAVTLMECGLSQDTTSLKNIAVIKLDRQTGLIAQTALAKLFNSSRFSICDIQKVMELTGLGNRKSLAYKKLSALHCIDYAEMPQELRDELPNIINELLTKDEISESANKALAGINF